jgi:hypothetical protein
LAEVPNQSKRANDTVSTDAGTNTQIAKWKHKTASTNYSRRTRSYTHIIMYNRDKIKIILINQLYHFLTFSEVDRD